MKDTTWLYCSAIILRIHYHNNASPALNKKGPTGRVHNALHILVEMVTSDIHFSIQIKSVRIMSVYAGIQVKLLTIMRLSFYF
jgi:hypothetical protein